LRWRLCDWGLNAGNFVVDSLFSFGNGCKFGSWSLLGLDLLSDRIINLNGKEISIRREALRELHVSIPQWNVAVLTHLGRLLGATNAR
jgi:hypothetical protein